jgi:hypothetical protein
MTEIRSNYEVYVEKLEVILKDILELEYIDTLILLESLIVGVVLYGISLGLSEKTLLTQIMASAEEKLDSGASEKIRALVKTMQH